jgi:hypothetical protein
VRRSLLVLLSAVLLGAIAFFAWTSSPTVPLTLTRQEAIDRAAVDATVEGQVAWTRVESKLVTYAEWRRVFSAPSSHAKDTINPEALFWIVAYLGRLVPVESPSYRCDWVIRVFPADERVPATFGASMCGQGGWQWEFAVLPDHSWARLDVFR